MADLVKLFNKYGINTRNYFFINLPYYYTAPKNIENNCQAERYEHARSRTIELRLKISFIIE